jgi:hypothetical protein
LKILKIIDQAEEQEIRQMHERQRKLHLIPTPLCYVGLDVVDGNGDPYAKYEDRSKSWVRNFYNWMVTQQMCCYASDIGSGTFGSGSLHLKSTAGELSTNPGTFRIDTAALGYGLIGGVNATNKTNGIWVGTGTALENFNDHTLSNKVLNGSSVGQLLYQDMSKPPLSWDNVNKTMVGVLSRVMFNRSGSQINVTETGIVAYLRYGNFADDYLVARDLLASPVPVPDAGQLTVTYTIQITYPE